jgi:CMP/dCMP kinase
LKPKGESRLPCMAPLRILGSRTSRAAYRLAHSNGGMEKRGCQGARHAKDGKNRMDRIRMGRKGILITVDGPAGGGKSTVSRLLAAALGVFYLDTGAMYRAVALQARRARVAPMDGRGLARLCSEMELHFEEVNGAARLFVGCEDISLAIRSPEMDLLSSRVSAVREVREAMTEMQRRIGSDGGLVAEGRDMGTVVFPKADAKFFLTAAPEIRVERRYRERIQRGDGISREEVERELTRRDEQDMKRSLAPLVPAEDAMILDTTALHAEQVVEVMLRRIRQEGLLKKRD